jgi:hypothetical protein
VKLMNAGHEEAFINYVVTIQDKEQSYKDSSFDSSVDLKKAVHAQL